MQIPRDAVLLRIFFGEDDKFGHLPLYEAIVLKAREMHLGGATVLRGTSDSAIPAKFIRPKFCGCRRICRSVVEIVDSQEKIDAFLPTLDKMMTSGLVTIEKVQVLQYGSARYIRGRKIRGRHNPHWKMTAMKRRRRAGA